MNRWLGFKVLLQAESLTKRDTLSDFVLLVEFSVSQELFDNSYDEWGYFSVQWHKSYFSLESI